MSRARIGTLAMWLWVLMLVILLSPGLVMTTLIVVRCAIYGNQPGSNFGDIRVALVPLGMILSIALTVLVFLWCAQSSLKRFFAPSSLDGAAVWGCAVIRVILTTALVVSIPGWIFSERMISDMSSSVGASFAWSLCPSIVYIVGIILVPSLMKFVTRQVDTSVMWYTVVFSKLKGKLVYDEDE